MLRGDTSKKRFKSREAFPVSGKKESVEKPNTQSDIFPSQSADWFSRGKTEDCKELLVGEDKLLPKNKLWYRRREEGRSEKSCTDFRNWGFYVRESRQLIGGY